MALTASTAATVAGARDVSRLEPRVCLCDIYYTKVFFRSTLLRLGQRGRPHVRLPPHPTISM